MVFQFIYSSSCAFGSNILFKSSHVANKIGLFNSMQQTLSARSCENLSYAICKRQRRRSACASAQSDQRLCFRCRDSIMPIRAKSKIPRLYLVFVTEQAGLRLTSSNNPESRFSRVVALIRHQSIR